MFRGREAILPLRRIYPLTFSLRLRASARTAIPRPPLTNTDQSAATGPFSAAGFRVNHTVPISATHSHAEKRNRSVDASR